MGIKCISSQLPVSIEEWNNMCCILQGVSSFMKMISREKLLPVNKQQYEEGLAISLLGMVDFILFQRIYNLGFTSLKVTIVGTLLEFYNDI